MTRNIPRSLTPRGGSLAALAARALLVTAFGAAVPLAACSDPTAVDPLGDFMILSPGDYYFSSALTIRPSAASGDSVLFRWSPARGATSYTIVFAKAQSIDSMTNYRADLSQPAFTIPVSDPQEITIPYGVPNPQLDTVPVAMYPALQHVVRLRDLDALIAAEPRNTPLYYVWTIQAHSGAKTARSIEKHRLVLNRLP